FKCESAGNRALTGLNQGEQDINILGGIEGNVDSLSFVGGRAKPSSPASAPKRARNLHRHSGYVRTWGRCRAHASVAGRIDVSWRAGNFDHRGERVVGMRGIEACET